MTKLFLLQTYDANDNINYPLFSENAQALNIFAKGLLEIGFITNVQLAEQIPEKGLSVEDMILYLEEHNNGSLEIPNIIKELKKINKECDCKCHKKGQ